MWIVAPANDSRGIVELSVGEKEGLSRAGVLRVAGADAFTDAAILALQWERLVGLYSPLVYHWCRQYGVQHFFDKSLEFDRVIDALHDYARRRV